MKTEELMCYFKELFGNNPKCELNYKTDIDLLVAIILSAQCTDKRVNMVTEKLFKKYKTVKDYANADIKELENEIHSCGFYRNKAKNIINMAKQYNEQKTVEELIKLPGVGRKTANVFLAEWHKVPAIAVDTHVIRVSNRLGFTKSENPDVIERDLMRLIDRKEWRFVNMFMVLFGRYYCKAVNPACDNCKLGLQCNYVFRQSRNNDKSRQRRQRACVILP